MFNLYMLSSILLNSMNSGEFPQGLVPHACTEAELDPAKLNESLIGQRLAVCLTTSRLHKIVPCEFVVSDCKKENCFSPNGMSSCLPCRKHYELMRLKAWEGLTEYLKSCMPLASPDTKQRGWRWFKNVHSEILNCAYRECLLFEIMCYAKGLSDLNLGILADGLRELVECGLRPHVERSIMHSCGNNHGWREGVKAEFLPLYVQYIV